MLSTKSTLNGSYLEKSQLTSDSLKSTIEDYKKSSYEDLEKLVPGHDV